MSTETGDKAVASEILGQAKAMVEAAAVEEEQLDLLDPITPEEMAEAREDLGAGAGGLSVLRHAREKRRGRPKGVRNKRTEDFRRYLMQFGQHPAITMMQLQATPEEVLMARSRRARTKIIGKGDNARLVTIEEEMTFEAAAGLRVRCAEGVLPYLESKMPIAVDTTIRGVMIVEEVGGASAAHGVTIDVDPLGVLPIYGEGEE